MRKRYTVRDYKQIMEICQTEKTRQAVGKIMLVSFEGVSKHLRRMTNDLIKTRRDQSDPNAKTYYTAIEGKTDADILACFKKHSNINNPTLYDFDATEYAPKVSVNKNPKKSRKEVAMQNINFSSSEIGFSYELPKDKSSITDKGVVIELAPGHMKVNGLTGYHSGKIKRARLKTHVGCSSEII